MKIAARVSNTPSGHAVEVETEGRKQSIAIAPKNAGRGSSINSSRFRLVCRCRDVRCSKQKGGRRESHGARQSAMDVSETSSG